MKIKGLEGLTPADIRTEIDNGARFVAYSWCVSLVVVTLKRSSDIYFVRAGQSSFRPNFIHSFLTLVLGWWGFPWGPIYSIGALVTNLRGGTDLTDALARDILQQSGIEYTPTVKKRREPGAWLAPIAALASVAALVFGGFLVFQYGESQTMPVALVNGLDASYPVTIDGQTRTLAPHSTSRLTHAEGRFEVRATIPGGTGECAFVVDNGDAADSLFNRKAVFINPDATAAIAVETTYYSTNTATVPKPPDPEIYAGQQSVVIKRPDYFVRAFPSRIDTSSLAGYTPKTRAYALDSLGMLDVVEIVRHYQGEAAVLDYIKRQGKLRPNDELVLSLPIRFLDNKEDGAAFFEQHLETRPVLVNWHRFYQQYMSIHFPERDLAAFYRNAAAAEPDCGALIYLYGRIADDLSESQACYRRALQVAQPCEYAHAAIAWDLLGCGDYSSALKELDLARSSGVDYSGSMMARRECLLALHRFDEALRDYESTPKASMSAYEEAQQRLLLTYLAEGRDAADRTIDAFIKSLPAGYGPEARENYRAYLQSTLAYADGDVHAFATLKSKDTSAPMAFTIALCEQDLDAMDEALDALEMKQASTWFSAYLSAHDSDASRAEGYWQSAVAALETQSPICRRIAAFLRDPETYPVSEILDESLSLADKRVYFAAIGTHEPRWREAFLTRSAVCDIEPTFPHHLIAAATSEYTAN